MLTSFTWSAGRPRAAIAASMALRCTGGISTGICVGSTVGAPVGAAVGTLVGAAVGVTAGDWVGWPVAATGTWVGVEAAGVAVTSPMTGPAGVAHAASKTPNIETTISIRFIIMNSPSHRY